MRCAVLGDPVAHSLSPVLHRAGYAALGLEGWEYDAVRVPAGTLADFLAGLGGEWRGLSLTMPLKRELVEWIEAGHGTMSDRVRLTGAANTLVRDGDAWRADNTDLPGAHAAIRERYDGPLDRAVLLGAGATAASTGLALVEAGTTSVTVLARDASRAAETIAAIAAHPGAPAVAYAPLDDVVSVAAGADVAVSTIPATAQGGALVGALAATPLVFEVLYDPWPTPLAAAASKAGSVVVGGLDLLVHQAVLQFEQFTGVAGPLDALRSAGERALAERARGGAHG